MRRYLANGKCIYCHSDKNVEDQVLNIQRKSVVVSVCSPRCLSLFLESLISEKSRRRFFKFASNAGRY
ncbi:MAG: hypothetical protein NUV68_00765 [Caldiserica bacterium]|jgi:hypothetical protein|nr:hypothetical protein [Caldisericota bacterium]MDH7561891.1 hypothetical protein [Caldisericota bacterium]